MQLKSEVDSDIQQSLRSNGIAFPLNSKGMIDICEFIIDESANAGMLYIIPKHELPDGELPFIVVKAQWVYGVFHFNNKAAIIEVGKKAISYEIND